MRFLEAWVLDKTKKKFPAKEPGTFVYTRIAVTLFLVELLASIAPLRFR